tara:strand:+ start:869 stop:1318 length:450 start_codon:yes stop_codon:yes gene_type:complete
MIHNVLLKRSELGNNLFKLYCNTKYSYDDYICKLDSLGKKSLKAIIKNIKEQKVISDRDTNKLKLLEHSVLFVNGYSEVGYIGEYLSRDVLKNKPLSAISLYLCKKKKHDSFTIFIRAIDLSCSDRHLILCNSDSVVKVFNHLLEYNSC